MFAIIRRTKNAESFQIYDGKERKRKGVATRRKKELSRVLFVVEVTPFIRSLLSSLAEGDRERKKEAPAGKAGYLPGYPACVTNARSYVFGVISHGGNTYFKDFANIARTRRISYKSREMYQMNSARLHFLFLLG